MIPSLTPTVELNLGEDIITSFTTDPATYWRDMAWQAAFAMAAGMIALWAMGNPHIWTGGVGGLAAIAVRAFYVSSDEFGVRWDLTNQRLLGPGDRDTALGDITNVRPFLTAVQVVTVRGDKHLIKYQSDRDATTAAIARAMAMA